MENVNYLNVGCGSKFHKSWVNIDMVSYSPYVRKCNLIKGIPYPDNQFDVVYHSQVLEHIPKDKAHFFIQECYRVLKPGGIIRIVVPDLENIVDEYKKHLNQNLNNPDAVSEANYDWNLIELYDQTVRNSTGGYMVEYLKSQNIPNEQYVMHRMGYEGIKQKKKMSLSTRQKLDLILSSKEMQQKAFKQVLNKVKNFFRSEQTVVGSFRLGGEIHYWMYDRYSLGRLLKECGFKNMLVKSPFESDIPDWGKYELDVKEGMVYDPASLFMEGTK